MEPAPSKWLDGYSGQSTEELLSLYGDYRTGSLVLAFEEGITAKLDRDGVQTLTEEERIVLAIEALEREVNNGGYEQFFVNSSFAFMPMIVTALQRIGCHKTAAVSQEAINALGTSELTPEVVHQVICSDDDELLATLSRCNTAYFHSGESIEEQLFSFIQAHKESITL